MMVTPQQLNGVLKIKLKKMTTKQRAMLDSYVCFWSGIKNCMFKPESKGLPFKMTVVK